MDRSIRTEEMRVFFEEKAAGYDDVHGPMMANKAVITDALPADTRRVLDLGAGTGLELIPLFARFPRARVTAVDVSPRMLEQLARRPFAGQVDIICGDFFDADLGTGYDAVISSAALHHFGHGDKAVLYRKIWHALRPGGVFVNSDRFVDGAEEERLLREYEEEPGKYRHMDTPLSWESESRILRDAGFVGGEWHALADPRYAWAAARRP